MRSTAFTNKNARDAAGRKINMIAIIPARGGSRRLPRKNIADFMGKPMIAWTIDAARDSGLFSQIIVATDCEPIAAVSRACGAQVPFLRGPDDSDDHTPVWVATINALNRLEAQQAERHDVVVQLMANCPLRTAADIRNAHDAFVETGTDFLISVFRYGWINPWWALKVEADTGRPRFLFPEARKRSQDLPPLYCPSGAIWMADAAALKNQKTFYGTEWRVFPMDWRHAVDIDDPADLQMALAIARQR